MDDVDIVALAERIRTQLPQLLPADDVAAVDATIADLVDRGRRGEPVASAVLRLLWDNPTLRQKFVDEGPQSGRRVVTPPPGDRRVPLPPRYVCPNGDFEYFRADVSRSVPPCPNDGATLILEDPA